jgi:hypothetical protein
LGTDKRAFAGVATRDEAMSKDESESESASKPMEKVLTKVYDDLVHPAAAGVGVALGGTVTRAVKLALRPVDGMLWSFEQSLAWLEEKVAELLTSRQVPEERIVTPSVQILGQAVSGARLAGSDELRSLYAALLASAMDSKTARDTHPSFGEVIRQLSPDDAKLIAYASENGKRECLVNAKFAFSTDDEGGKSTFNYEISAFNLGEQAQLAYTGGIWRYIGNITRLGLVQLYEIETEEHPPPQQSASTSSQSFSPLIQEFGSKLPLYGTTGVPWDEIRNLDSVISFAAIKEADCIAYLKKHRLSARVKTLLFTTFGSDFLNACVEAGHAGVSTIREV